MRFWVSDIDPRKIVRATRPGLGGNSDIQLATPDGWKDGDVDLAHSVFGEGGIDWHEVTSAGAHAALVEAGLRGGAATDG